MQLPPPPQKKRKNEAKLQFYVSYKDGTEAYSCHIKEKYYVVIFFFYVARIGFRRMGPWRCWKQVLEKRSLIREWVTKPLPRSAVWNLNIIKSIIIYDSVLEFVSLHLFPRIDTILASIFFPRIYTGQCIFKTKLVTTRRAIPLSLPIYSFPFHYKQIRVLKSIYVAESLKYKKKMY